MKRIFILLLVLISTSKIYSQQDSAPNIVLITIDGLRWQEVFNGCDTQLTKNTDIFTRLMWSDTSSEARRKKLMPFFWNVILEKGSLYGNRKFGSKVNISNFWRFSYPGYDEILTGKCDLIPVLNTPTYNNSDNLLGIINDSVPPYKNKVVAIGSWNILEYILNKRKSNFKINSGFSGINDTSFNILNSLQDSINDKSRTRFDELTFLYSRHYIDKYKPKMIYIGFGETDEFAHHKRYDLYLQQINKIDRMIGELWSMMQKDTFYKDNTIFIITTDHGRGRSPKTWSYHFPLLPGCDETWMSIIGNKIKSVGEVKFESQVYQKDLFSLILDYANQQ